MTYARQRLLLGITGVGSTVLLCLAAVLFDLPHRWISPLSDQSYGSALAAIALTWMVHAALLAPLDLLGGLVFVRERPAALRWLSGWLRGVLVQWIWFLFAAALLLRMGQQFGITNAVLVFLLLQLVLLSRQGLMAWLVGGLRFGAPSARLTAAIAALSHTPSSVREIASDEPSFVGGWTGVDAGALWVPARWVTELAPQQLAVALERRIGVRSLGLRRRGALIALAWNTAGFALATSAPRADLMTAAGFVTVMAWFTLWSFVGVLVLPSLSRPAVLLADAWARRTSEVSDIVATIERLDGWQDDEAERAPGVELIFHPVPARSARVRALLNAESPQPATGAWHATRMMLYLSWAGLGGLSRAVHCNIGRPAVWVLLPGD
jgi:hypothetical protein